MRTDSLQWLKGVVQDGINAVELSPACAEALYYRGQARHSLGRHDEALIDLGAAIECCGPKQR